MLDQHNINILKQIVMKIKKMMNKLAMYQECALK